MDYERAAQSCANELNRINEEIEKNENANKDNVRLQEKYAGNQDYMDHLQKNKENTNKEIEKLKEQKAEQEARLQQIWAAKKADGDREREHPKQQEKKEEEKKEVKNEHEERDEIARQQREEQLRQQWEQSRSR